MDRAAITTSKQVIAKTTQDFLDGVTTPTHAKIAPFDLTTAMKYASTVLGQVKPMIFSIFNQRSLVDHTAPARLELILLVNPDSMNYGRTNSMQAAYTRNGYIIQPWGPNQDMLSATGKTAAFMTTSEGLAQVTSRSSLAFHNLLGLTAVYRNNGYQFEDITKPNTGIGTNQNNFIGRQISIVRGIELSWDGDIYNGHFNTFTLDNDAASPFQMSYNFEFICSTLSTNYRDVRGHFLPIPSDSTSVVTMTKSSFYDPPENIS